MESIAMPDLNLCGLSLSHKELIYEIRENHGMGLITDMELFNQIADVFALYEYDGRLETYYQKWIFVRSGSQFVRVAYDDRHKIEPSLIVKQ